MSNEINIVKIKDPEIYNYLRLDKKIMVLETISKMASQGYIIIVPLKIQQDLKEYQTAKMFN